MTSLRWRPDGDDTATVLGPTGRALAVYSWSARSNHPHFRDVRPLAHDGVLTTHAPWDHRWHHGLWWAWKFVDDVLYWEDHEGYGAGRGRGLGRSSVVDHAVTADDGAVTVRESLDWRPDATGVTALTERRVLTVHVPPGVPAGAWAVDWDLTWRAPRRTVLAAVARTQHAWGGYGGLFYRASRAMAADEVILAAGTAPGASPRPGVEQVHGQHVRWLAYGGNVDGAGDDEPARPARGGVAILAHPDDEPDGLTAFVTSATAGMGFVGAAPLFDGDVVLEPDEPLRLRYRTLVLGALPEATELDAAWSAWRPSTPGTTTDDGTPPTS